MMWNPFKRKHLVPVDDCINAILDAIKRDDLYKSSTDLWGWLEEKGVKRKWSWSTQQNYLIFDTEHDYLLFLIKL